MFLNISEDKIQDVARFVDDLILLHPSLMQLTGICIGSHCIINNTCVKVAWPCTTLPLIGASVQDKLKEQLGCIKGQLISIQSHDHFCTASLVELYPVNR